MLQLSNIDKQAFAEIHSVLSQIGLHLDMKIAQFSELENIQVLKKQLSIEEISFFSQSIEILNLSTRTKNLLNREGIYDVGSLVTTTEQKWRYVSSFGTQAFTELNNMLSKRDLHLGMKIEWPPSPEQIQKLKKQLSIEEMKFFSQSIEILNLSARIQRMLFTIEIHKVGDLVTQTEERLRRLSRFGKKSFAEIHNVLSEINLYLGMDIQWPLSPEYNKDNNQQKDIQSKGLGFPVQIFFIKLFERTDSVNDHYY